MLFWGFSFQYAEASFLEVYRNLFKLWREADSVWVDKRLPALRQHRWGAIAGCAIVVVIAIGIKLLLPNIPPFLTLFPAVLLSALIGGRWAGITAMIICTIAGAIFIFTVHAVDNLLWRSISLGLFVIVTGLIVFVVDLLDTAVSRLQKERQKLDLVLKEADAAIWELHPGKTLHWDKTFFDLMGLQRSDHPPSMDRFLELVHPDDRAALREARSHMDQGRKPRRIDEYRVFRPDGRLVWLENHRVPVDSDKSFFIGITQDITRRKKAEEQVKVLLSELAHRMKNQYAVIMRMTKETYQQTRSENEFNAVFGSRMMSLSRSHELLIGGTSSGVDLHQLLRSQLQAFGFDSRVKASGPPLRLSANAVQYLGMAFHELGTNSAKYGALSHNAGILDISWSTAVSDGSSGRFHFLWKETGGKKPHGISRSGFGSQVLQRYVPAALSGEAALRAGRAGINWTLHAPLSEIIERE